MIPTSINIDFNHINSQVPCAIDLNSASGLELARTGVECLLQGKVFGLSNLFIRGIFVMSNHEQLKKKKKKDPGSLKSGCTK